MVQAAGLAIAGVASAVPSIVGSATGGGGGGSNDRSAEIFAKMSAEAAEQQTRMSQQMFDSQAQHSKEMREQQNKLTKMHMDQIQEEFFLPVDNIDGQDIKLWYRTWGKPVEQGGIPVLFVHGGPGNCIADYKNINAEFFDAETFFVIEVDQRGTGNSVPNVRDLSVPDGYVAKSEIDGFNNGVANMKYYMDISINQMSEDFEKIRMHLQIEKWLVFGGSWGSTLGLDYAERFPRACLGLIVRGIFLCTEEEMDEIYAVKAIDALAAKHNNPRYRKEFDMFFAVAEKEYNRRKGDADGTVLDPNDAKTILEIYESLIVAGDKEAIWKWFVYEVNLMEEDESKLMDPETIDEADYPEAQSVAFFEARLFLKGVYESKPALDLIGDVTNLTTTHLATGSGGVELVDNYHVPVWLVQGTGDAVCPEAFAEKLMRKLQDAGVLMESHFVDAGHKASSTGIRDTLIECVKRFYTFYTSEGK